MTLRRPVKLVVTGDFSVGKSSICRRYVTGAFSEQYRATVGATVLQHHLELEDGSRQPLVLFDLEGGRDRLDKLVPFLRGAAGAVLVADCTVPDSYAHLADYVRFLRAALPGCPLAFALNKADLPHPLTQVAQACARLSAEHDLHPDAAVPAAQATSAATGQGLDRLFAALLARLDPPLAIASVRAADAAGAL